MVNAKVIVKYALLQLAETSVVVGALLLVRQFVSNPVWMIVTILALWEGELWKAEIRNHGPAAERG
ncbi:MAG: hypothetical protein M1274_06840 [Actinobacteria bacterium]|nr:hypothetical protein [Actinomycetota bacterium]